MEISKGKVGGCKWEEVIWNFCDKKIYGGTNCLKYHLARRKENDVRGCSSVLVDIESECNALLVNYHEKRELKCKTCEAMAIPPSIPHLKGTDNTFSHFVRRSGSNPLVAYYGSGTKESYFVEHSTLGSQPMLEGMTTWNEDKKAIAYFLYFSDLSFNLPRSP